MNTKNSALFLLIFLFAAVLYSQNIKESDVPQAVKTKFSAMYPDVSNTKWEMENGKYEAEFKENNTETSVIFEANGMYVQTETEISVSTLPAGVNDYVSKNLPGKKINEASQITLTDGTVVYEAEIGKEDYLFDSGGNYLRKDSDNGNTEDDDN
jgi:hypothetical protein